MAIGSGDVGRAYLDRVVAAAKQQDSVAEALDRAEAATERITARYGNPLGVRVSGGPAGGRDDLLASVADLRSNVAIASHNLSAVVHATREIVSAADLDAIEAQVIAARYFRFPPHSWSYIAADVAALSGEECTRSKVRVIAARADRKVGDALQCLNPDVYAEIYDDICSRIAFMSDDCERMMVL